MKITYDKIADAMYFVLKQGKIKKTIKMEDHLFVDVDAKGNVLGIEMLNVAAQGNITDFKKVAKEGIPFSILSNSAVAV